MCRQRLILYSTLLHIIGNARAGDYRHHHHHSTTVIIIIITTIIVVIITVIVAIMQVALQFLSDRPLKVQLLPSSTIVSLPCAWEKVGRVTYAFFTSHPTHIFAQHESHLMRLPAHCRWKSRGHSRRQQGQGDRRRRDVCCKSARFSQVQVLPPATASIAVVAIVGAPLPSHVTCQWRGKPRQLACHHHAA